MHSVMKFPQALYVADYLSRKGVEFGLALAKIIPIRHKSMLFIPDIWRIPQLFFSLQRQIDINFEWYEKSEILGCIGHWSYECNKHEGSESANAGVPE